MKMPKYLSPSSISQFYQDRNEFYLRYLAENKPPKIPQNKAMSIGSAFDAFIKADIAEKIFGEIRDQFDLTTIFETQVEEQNRDWAWKHGKHVFNQYVKTGAREDLLKELEKADGEPRLEFTVEGTIYDVESGYEVPLLGKPDLYYKNRKGHHIIRDWKVNGYCAKRAQSPKPRYVNLRYGTQSLGPHKDAHLHEVGDLTINIAGHMEDTDAGWANQLSIYAWILGEPIGGKFNVDIEQLVSVTPEKEFPDIKIAHHRARISQDFQTELAYKVVHVWKTLNSGHIFEDMTREESDAQCSSLEEMHKAFESGGDDDKEDWFNKMMR